VRLRDAAEHTVRRWNAHEIARGARQVIDFDTAPPATDSPPIEPAASRLDVHAKPTFRAGVPPPHRQRARSRRPKPWTVEEARQFLESARADGDALYAAYVLILVLGLRRGEVLGLAWDDVDLDAGEVYIAWQVQRVGGKLLRRQTKTEASDAPLPLPDICMTALKERRERQDRWRATAGDAWQGGELVVSTRYGLPVDPRNFHREFKTRCTKAGVRPIPVHSTRRTCASLLVALDVHPRVAMQIMRHSQIAVTMNIYSEVSSIETREALKKLGRELESVPNE
jgi:integrase